MRSMSWQLGMLGTISAFAYRHRETKKNLCRTYDKHTRIVFYLRYKDDSCKSLYHNYWLIKIMAITGRQTLMLLLILPGC